MSTDNLHTLFELQFVRGNTEFLNDCAKHGFFRHFPDKLRDDLSLSAIHGRVLQMTAVLISRNAAPLLSQAMTVIKFS